MNDRKYSIFISSTYKDLEEYRQNVHDAILIDGNFPIAMENFPSSNNSPWETIKQLIDECDYYILIIGFIYGTIDEETGDSYTEKEYDYAKSINKHILSFILNDSFKLKKDEDLAKIESFKQKVKNNGKLSKFCKNKNNLSSDIVSTLHKEFKRNQKAGWIKAKDYNKLKFDYEQLLVNYEELINPIDISDLTNMDEKIILNGYMDIGNSCWQHSISLKKIFLKIANFIFEYFPEDTIFYFLFQYIEFDGHRPNYIVDIDADSKRVVRNKLKKYGLITYSTKTIQGETAINWKLTKKGKYYFDNEDS